MGELIAYAQQQALAVVSNKTQEQLQAEQEKRQKDALVLEDKLKIINETIPTRIYNTSSSSAGAGSGDFHMYRMVRKAEQERQKRLDEAFIKDTERQEFEEKKKQRDEEEAEKTAKRRAKRQKQKAKKGKKAKAAGGNGAGGPASNDDSSSDEDKPEQAALD